MFLANPLPALLTLQCKTKYLLVFIIVLLNCHNVVTANEPLTPITLQLQWNHQFQFAGYYAALAKGYYEKAGLAVTIKDGGYDETGHAILPEEEVLFNRAQFGSTRTDLLISHSEGLPVVVLANIMQHSPYIFLSTKRYDFSRLEDIDYLRPITLNINALGSNRIDAEALAALKVAGVNLKRLNNSPPTWQLNDLLEGKSQLIPAYSTDEPYFIRKSGRVPVSIEPRSYGIDFYGDLLFTSQKMLNHHPDIVSKFRMASLNGWKYAMDYPEVVIDLIVKNYKTRNANYDKTFLLYEADQLRNLINPDIIEIGYINQQRWKNIAETYKSLGIIKEYDLGSFLYKPEKLSFWQKYKQWGFIILSVFLLSIAIIFYLYYLTKKLKKEIKKRQEIEVELKLLAQIDSLTGIDNRYVLDRNLDREFHLSRRQGLHLAMLMIDLDDFKMINDEFGHQAGDQVLKSFVNTSKNLLRNSDLFARYGGEEFVILLPATQINEAISLGSRILRSNSDNIVVFDGFSISYTISIGAAELNSSDHSPNELLNRCDQNLYKAKQSGKNRIFQ